MSDLTEQWRAAVSAAATAGASLCLRGGGSKDFYGRTPTGTVLDTRGHTGVVAYEPTELVVTVRAGTPLAELENLLTAQGQMLPFEPPRFGAATIGGCVAAGLSGPRRMAAGAVRDYMLGVKIIDGRAEVLSFGGQVMKNVAGYDVSRLLAGSLGTLGLILEVSLKVLPLPVREASVRFALGETEALKCLNEWGGQPLPVSASAWHRGELVVRLSGADAAVASARTRLGGEPMAERDAAQYWLGVREQTHAFFAGSDEPEGDSPLWRLAVPTTAPALALDGEQLIEWGGGLRWLRTRVPADVVRARVAAVGGHATQYRGDARDGEVFEPLPAVLMNIHRRLKQSFDPAGVFNPGRLYSGI